MEENKDIVTQNTAKKGLFAHAPILKDILAGFCIGVAFIIPGFSGGSVAAILGIYEKLIGAIADLPRTPKKSIKTLLPIFIGLVLGAISLLYPLRFALSVAPLPTVSLFVGLAIGGMYSITDKVKGKRATAGQLFALIIPLLVALALSFIPTGADVDLFALSFGGYVLLFLIGVLGSAALVIPGISGSMILLILGYYNPIVKVITDHLFSGKDMLLSLAVLGTAGAGIVLGFFLISIIMKQLLAKYPRGTYFAIIGFIVGSVPTVYVSTAKDAGYIASGLPTEVWQYVLCAVLLALGLVGAYLFAKHAVKPEANKNAPSESGT